MGETNLFLDIPNEIKPEDAGAFAGIVRGRKVILDVGCGHGDFLLEFAPKNPDNLYVGKRYGGSGAIRPRTGFTSGE
jgi:tRNA G46 methylase TrmB